MFTISKNAAEEIRRSADAGNMDGMPLRVAAAKNADGSIRYAIGFDETREGDTLIVSEGIDILLDEVAKGLLNGARMDFVEMEPGKYHFIFLNPNDPNYVEPREN